MLNICTSLPYLVHLDCEECQRVGDPLEGSILDHAVNITPGATGAPEWMPTLMRHR